MDDQTAGRVLATLDEHGRGIVEVKAGLAKEIEARTTGDSAVHSRINGIYKMGAGQLLGMLIAIVILLIKK